MTPLKVNKVYAPYLQDYSHRYEIYYGGAGSGKSFFVTQKLIIKGLNYPRKILVLRRDQVSLKKSVIALFLKILKKERIHYRYLKQERVIYIGESTILFEGIDDPEKIKSIEGITDIWMEEATEYVPSQFNQLVLRLRPDAPFPQFFLTFNPISELSYCYSYFFDTQSPRYFLQGKSNLILKTTYKDNLYFLPDSYVQELEDYRRTDYDYYRIYALGEFGVLNSSLIFNPKSYEVSSYTPSPSAIHLYGLDPGWTDKTAFVDIVIDGSTLYVSKELVKSNLLIKDLYQWLVDNNYRTKPIICDCAAAQVINELRKLGIYGIKPCKKTPDSVLSGIDQIKAYNIIIDPSCTETIKDFQNYQWKLDPKTGTYLRVPNRGQGELHQNTIDAIRYSLQSLGTKVRTIRHSLPKGL